MMYDSYDDNTDNDDSTSDEDYVDPLYTTGNSANWQWLVFLFLSLFPFKFQINNIIFCLSLGVTQLSIILNSNDLY